MEKQATAIDADKIGMISSGLCLIHCLITPFLFLGQACTSHCCQNSSLWWRSLDLVFFIISFIAVYHAIKKASKLWLKQAFYVLFISFSLLLANHHQEIISLPPQIPLGAAVLLFLLHLYNKKWGCCYTCSSHCNQ